MPNINCTPPKVDCSVTTPTKVCPTVCTNSDECYQEDEDGKEIILSPSVKTKVFSSVKPSIDFCAIMNLLQQTNQQIQQMNNNFVTKFHSIETKVVNIILKAEKNDQRIDNLEAQSKVEEEKVATLVMAIKMNDEKFNKLEVRLKLNEDKGEK